MSGGENSLERDVPKAESSGELFGLAILLVGLSFLNTKKLYFVDSINIIFCSVGLYASNNKTSFILLIFCLIYKFIKTYKLRSELLILLF